MAHPGNVGEMLASAGAGSIALGAAGGLLVVATLADLFLTIFNYDGFTFIAGRLHHALWKLIRTSCKVLPSRVLHASLSLASAGMVPATVALWLGLEVIGFALIFDPGMTSGAFKLTHASPSFGTALYLSGGAISSLTFGDAVPLAPLDRALVDLETVVGLATFTLALGYVVTTFGVLAALESLHGRVRRHAGEPERSTSIVARHFHGGDSSTLPSFLQELSDDLEQYDQGLRRYPIVYYIHTRRRRRAIPTVFATLGDLLGLLRWGLPSSEPLTRDPFLVALLTAYEEMLDRLRESFVGPDPFVPPEPVSLEAFAAREDEWVAQFRRLQAAAVRTTGVSDADGLEVAYERYREWLPFARHRQLVLDRVADALAYDRPAREPKPEVGLEPTTSSLQGTRSTS